MGQNSTKYRAKTAPKYGGQNGTKYEGQNSIKNRGQNGPRGAKIALVIRFGPRLEPKRYSLQSDTILILTINIPIWPCTWPKRLEK